MVTVNATSICIILAVAVLLYAAYRYGKSLSHAPLGAPEAAEQAAGQKPEQPPSLNVKTQRDAAAKSRVVLVYHPRCSWSVKFVNETWNRGLESKQFPSGISFEAVNVEDLSDPEENKDVAAIKAASNGGGFGFPTTLFTSPGRPDTLSPGYVKLPPFVEWVKAQHKETSDAS